MWLNIKPLNGIFYLPWHRHQVEGTFSCHIQKTQSVVSDIAQVSKQKQVDLNTDHLDCQSGGLTTELPCPHYLNGHMQTYITGN